MNGNEQSERSDRINRLLQAQKNGIAPYPSTLKWHRKKISEVIEKFDSLETKKTAVSIAGRILGMRLHGGLCFVDIADATGKMQLYLKKEHMGDLLFEHFSSLTDRGDFCAAKGICTKTKRGELSILVSEVQLLTKSLRPLPEKWHGLTNIETRFRKRELDLLSNPEAQRIARLRTSLVFLIRDFLSSKSFTEVETPILQSIAGGAIAKPFITRHEALSQDMFLRIAPELFLKRLIVGGFEKIFEIAKCFRNEGIDTWHNPEFTQVELYWAYADYEDLMALSEQLLKQIQERLFKTEKIIFNDSEAIDFTKPFTRIAYAEILKEHSGIDPFTTQTKDLAGYLSKKGKEPDAAWGRGKLIDEIFKISVRPKCIQPIFITAYPAELSPLAKRNAKDPRIVDQFQLLAGGMEIIKAFSECNDPQDQQARFAEQDKLKQQGDEEAHASDQEFIEALEYGMPPTAGLGMGIDRLMMLLANTQNIKEVILFPTLRNK